MREQVGHSKRVLLERVDFEMDQSQKELRRAANKAFMESLDHLGMRLKSAEEEAEVAPLQQPPKPLPSIDLESLEDAAADIEQYMKTFGGEEAARLEREAEVVVDAGAAEDARS
jgi:hypothetical protein